MNRLSLARMFLFGARDTWFVVGIPIYFHQVLSDGTPEGARLAFFLVGGFMAAWIIGYGAVQAAGAEAAARPARRSVADITRLAVVWVGGLTLIPAALALAALFPGAWLTPVLVVGPAGLRLRLRGEFLGAFLPDPRLHRRRAGDDGRRVLLHVERRRPASGHAAVGAQLPGRRAGALPCHRGDAWPGRVSWRRGGWRETGAVGVHDRERTATGSRPCSA